MNDKPIQTLQELAQNLRADCYYFVLPASAGDFYYHLLLKSSLEQKLKGKIIFVIKPSHEAVCDIFDCKDYIVCSNKDIVDNFWYPQWLETDNAVSMPTKGKFYPSHSGLLCMPVAHTSALNWHLEWFGLPKDTKGDLPTNLPKISESLRAKLDKIAPLNQIILFCPEANSFPKLPFIIFKDECQRLRKEGYSIVVNSLKYKKEYARFFMGGVYDLDLSLKDAIALRISCAGVISTRAGFCDIVAHYCKSLKIYYTAFSNYIMWDRVLPNTQRVYVCDVPIYKKFLQISRESLPIRLYKRYATKGFLKKLRLPFTAYFKIYRRYKGNDIAPKEMGEFIEQELMQSYEYNLGLALQKACERFWWGGFLLFPLVYLKIRVQKGKGFKRIDVLS